MVIPKKKPRLGWAALAAMAILPLQGAFADSSSSVAGGAETTNFAAGSGLALSAANYAGAGSGFSLDAAGAGIQAAQIGGNAFGLVVTGGGLGFVSSSSNGSAYVTESPQGVATSSRTASGTFALSLGDALAIGAANGAAATAAFR